MDLDKLKKQLADAKEKFMERPIGYSFVILCALGLIVPSSQDIFDERDAMKDKVYAMPSGSMVEREERQKASNKLKEFIKSQLGTEYSSKCYLKREPLYQMHGYTNTYGMSDEEAAKMEKNPSYPLWYFWCTTEKDGEGRKFLFTVSNEFLTDKEIKIFRNAKENTKISFTGLIHKWPDYMEFDNSAGKDSSKTLFFD